MPKSDEEIIKAVVERMYKRRVRESSETKAAFTMSYAISVRTGRCYVGYNLQDLNKTSDGSGVCAENRAAYLAASYGEKLHDMVFFALNAASELFNACTQCQTWVYNGRGFMKNQSGSWIICTTKPPYWTPNALSDAERETLYAAGDEAISAESADYFSTVHF
ncbi:MAG TPA: hypothetical protein VGV37_18475 [Aliidongia sp.]|uniref:hypothetical protein n=1 Tax=Aliidongia sp. TaxID=1914230 RepID=UPI002DDC9746|nr:hypothetical protein [Aliidongia sp.]HEV2676518.1 hypothetical protein [Aliidongia sp.]